MKTKRLKSWAELEHETQVLYQYVNQLRAEKKIHISDIIFRGQADYNWPLSSSLDRRTNHREVSMRSYHAMALDAFAEVKHLFPAQEKLNHSYQIDNFLDFIKAEDGYIWLAYLAFLRQHGFPSPLLDWSRSVEIAGYFAFSEPTHADHVALYAFIEYAGEAKGGWVGEPRIHEIGNQLPAHMRHDRQQSQYTMCTRTLVHQGPFHYTSHEEAFKLSDEGSDLLFKFEVPSEERIHVLKQLDAKGLNAQYLFCDGMDSIFRDLAFRLIDQRDGACTI